MESQDAQHGGHGEHNEIKVTVHAPRFPEPKVFTWAKTMKAGDAAQEAATAFQYQPGTYGLQTLDAEHRVLDNDKPLVAEHVKDGDELELIAKGGGV